VKTSSNEVRNINDRSVDGSCLKTEGRVPHYFLYQQSVYYHSALQHFCVTASFILPIETKKEKDITKLKALSHSEMRNVGSSTYVDGFPFNINAEVYATLNT
jgi:hypothetical protein